jgi:hypothetical protein
MTNVELSSFDKPKMKRTVVSISYYNNLAGLKVK